MINDSRILTFKLVNDYDKTIRDEILPKEVVKRLVYTTFDEVSTKLMPNEEFRELVDRLESMRSESLEFVKGDEEFVRDFMEGIVIGGFVDDEIINRAFDVMVNKCNVSSEFIDSISEDVSIATHQFNKDYNEEDLYDLDK